MALFDNKYLKIAKIGEGSFGNVFLVKKVRNEVSTSAADPTNKENEKEEEKEEQYFAIKKMKSSKNYADKLNDINEIKILSTLAHENIITIKDVFYQKEAVHILMDHMCYDLQKLISSSFEKLTLNHIKTISFQMLKGLDYLHKNQVIHRDVKSSNMLFEKSGILRISDFSISKKITPGHPMTKNIVTRFYRPAEIVFGEENYDFSLDMWSFGCVFAEFFLGAPLFPAETDLDLLGKIFQILGTANEEDWPKCKSLPFFLEYEINNPIGLKNAIPKIQEHKEAFDLLSNLLILNPEKRLTAEKALNHPFFDIKDDFSYSKFLVDEKLMKKLSKK